MLYLAYLLVAVLVIVYLSIYRPYVSNLAAHDHQDNWDRFPQIQPETLRRLGSIGSRSALHFTEYSLEKRAGVVRLCAIGDSHTAGDEVASDLDYPSYLQRELVELDADNVEVLNFGNGWYGFSQTTVMWEEVAIRYGCDAVLLLVFDFWWRRDTTFHHSGESVPYYLHSRHVLAGNGVRLVEVSGTTARQRFDGYHGFFPGLRYLRYDRHPPAIIRSMLPDGRELPNPFYYASDPATEWYEVSRRLLHRIAGAGMPVFVMVKHDGPLRETLTTNPDVNVALSRFIKDGAEFPYVAPISHGSSWEQQRVARHFLRLLLDDPPRPLPQLHFDDVSPAASWEAPPPLDRADAISVEFGGDVVGVLVSVHERDQGDEERHFATLSGSGHRGLLAVKPPGTSLFDACLVALEQLPAPADEVRIEYAGGRVETLGVPRLAAPGVAIWVLEQPGVYCSWQGTLNVVLREVRLSTSARLAVGANRVAGKVDGNRFLVGSDGQTVFRFRGLGHYSAEVRKIGATGDVLLALEFPEGTRRVPVSRWRLETPDNDAVEHLPPREQLVIGNGGARFVAR